MAHTLVYGVAAFAAFAAISFFHLRNIWLSFAVTLGPIPGVLLSGRFTIPFVLRDKILIAAFCLVLFEMIAAAFIERRVDTTEAQASNDNTEKRAALLNVFVLIAFAGLRFWLNKPAAALGILLIAFAALASSAASLLLAIQFFKPSESFVAKFNRRRERSERIFEMIAPVAFSRWGFSVFGMTLALSAMALFGAHATWPILAENKILFASLTLFVGLLAIAVAKDLRRAAAGVFALGWTGMIEAWGASFHSTILRSAALTIYVMTLAIAFVLVFTMLAQHRRFMLASDAANEAGAQAIVTLGRSTVFATSGGFVFLVVWWADGLLPLWPAFTLAVAGAASLLLYPATAAVFETLFFRRRSVDELYKLK